MTLKIPDGISRQGIARGAYEFFPRAGRAARDPNYRGVANVGGYRGLSQGIFLFFSFIFFYISRLD